MRDIINLLRMSLNLIKKSVLFLVGTVVLFSLFYFYNNRLFLFEARLLWPQNEFEQEKFRLGSIEDRAAMSVNLIERGELIGMPINLIPQYLGPSTGDYYHQDTNYTYQLTDRGSADWILTFVSNDEGTVSKIFIRKSCCSISRKILSAILF